MNTNETQKYRKKDLLYLIPAAIAFFAWMILGIDASFKAGIILMLYLIYERLGGIRN